MASLSLCAHTYFFVRPFLCPQIVSWILQAITTIFPACLSSSYLMHQEKKSNMTCPGQANTKKSCKIIQDLTQDKKREINSVCVHHTTMSHFISSYIYFFSLKKSENYSGQRILTYTIFFLHLRKKTAYSSPHAFIMSESEQEERRPKRKK